MKYRLPTTHKQEAEQADARFMRCENDLILTPEQIREMNERIAAQRADFLRRARNLREAKQVRQKDGEE